MYELLLVYKYFSTEAEIKHECSQKLGIYFLLMKSLTEEKLGRLTLFPTEKFSTGVLN